MSEDLSGYRGETLQALQTLGIKVGDIISVTREEVVYEGILMPRFECGDESHIVVKLKSGYNIGVRLSPTTRIVKKGDGPKPAFIPPPLPNQESNLPSVSIISTGGTIASRVDYRTGAVRPALSASDLYSVVPELSKIAKINADIVFSLLSENITPKHWTTLAKILYSHIKNDVSGLVVAHGTDTLAYTSAALSFALQDLPVPIIMVGSQRSADRPSSDAATNLTGAVTAAAKAPFAEVVLAMHETISDDSIIFHRGTKVRKCHTSRRDAFESINTAPLARMDKELITMLTKNYNRRKPDRQPVLRPDFDERVALIKVHPGLDPSTIDWYINKGYRGIIIEGTGLGHLGKYLFSTIKKAIDNNIVVAMTSQCIWGRLNMNVYDTGRDLIEIGVVPLEDTLAETALVKLMWILGSLKPNTPAKTKNLMLTNFAGEMSSRSTFT